MSGDVHVPRLPLTARSLGVRVRFREEIHTSFSSAGTSLLSGSSDRLGTRNYSTLLRLFLPGSSSRALVSASRPLGVCPMPVPVFSLCVVGLVSGFSGARRRSARMSVFGHTRLKLSSCTSVGCLLRADVGYRGIVLEVFPAAGRGGGGGRWAVVDFGCMRNGTIEIQHFWDVRVGDLVREKAVKAAVLWSVFLFCTDAHETPRSLVSSRRVCPRMTSAAPPH